MTDEKTAALRDALSNYILARDRLFDVNDTGNTADVFEAAVGEMDRVVREWLAATEPEAGATTRGSGHE